MSDATTQPEPMGDDPIEHEPAQPSDEAGAGDARSGEPLDLDTIERDLAGVEAALGRLDDGTYWTDEVTGETIPDEVLASDPVARRAS